MNGGCGVPAKWTSGKVQTSAEYRYVRQAGVSGGPWRPRLLIDGAVGDNKEGGQLTGHVKLCIPRYLMTAHQTSPPTKLRRPFNAAAQTGFGWTWLHCAPEPGRFP